MGKKELKHIYVNILKNGYTLEASFEQKFDRKDGEGTRTEYSQEENVCTTKGEVTAVIDGLL